MSEIKNQNNAYIVQLDGLRFFAILSVMIGHWLQWQINKPIIQAFPFSNGVILFFVLSGYLITDILLQNKIKSVEISIPKSTIIKSFYARRVLRIFPLYFGIILFLYIISFKNTRELLPWLITFSSNIYQSIHNVFVGDFNHFWSLAVEEQFYLIWPWVIILIPTKHSEKIIIGLIFLSLLTKIYLFKYYPDNWMANSYFTLSCMHALSIGALVAYWKIYRKNLIIYISKFIWVLASIIIYFSIHYLSFFKQVGWLHAIFDDILFASMSAIVINYASQNKFTGVFKYILENKFVVYSGKISYGLYVFHLFVPGLFWGYLSGKLGLDITNKYTAAVVFYFITFAMAHISWKLIENPINNLKKYFPYLTAKE
ncbi:MAG TPA: acyltransferase [Bacteroidia bacterium]|nr:acyltransferase [Bacteroidia bacterium]